VSIDDNVYICVVPPENLDAVTPLLAMVNSLGHHVHIVEVETGSTSYVIRAAITGNYQPGITRFALIPAKHQQLESKSYGSFVGDFYYELMDSDNLPDIAVGRYPGNYTQLENQTIKAMSYMTYAGDPAQPSLPASVILAAHEEGYPGGYTANSNAVKNWSYSLSDPVFETCYPDEGGTAEQVENAMNNGVGIVNYRGHGSNTTWQWSPGWNAGSVYGLSNTYFPPVFNVCCSNGNHAETYNCLSESWLDGPGTGASGNIGASAPSLTVVNNRMQKVLFWEIFDEGNTCAGEMFAAAQTDIIQTQSGGGLNNARMYHWFGDPSMDIPNGDLPGTPFPLAVDAPAFLNFGANSLHLTVTSNGTPVEGAVVTVTDGIGNHPQHTETFYAQQITNGTGEAWLDFTAVEGEDLYYGVRLHNHASVTGTIGLTTEGIEGGTANSVNLDPVIPSPASVTAGITFSAPSGTHVNIQVVDLAGRTVSILYDQQVMSGVNSLTLSVSEMSSGLYFVIMQAQNSIISRKILVVR
jgi:gingipain R